MVSQGPPNAVEATGSPARASADFYTLADELWHNVIGQSEAVAMLRGAAAEPVHAYLFTGPSGSGRLQAAQAFAATLFAGAASDEEKARRHVQLVSRQAHPDFTVVERKGASIPVGNADHPEEGSARWVAQRAALASVEAAYSVYVLMDFHLVGDAAPVLLKTIEEPPPHVVFIVLADEVTPELVTIASRCVTVPFRRVPAEIIADQLQAEGVDASRAQTAAESSLGDLRRARLLVSDPRIGVRLEAWSAIPERLDGTGSTAAEIAAEIRAQLDDATAPLVEAHEAETKELAETESAYGRSATGKKDLEARQRRELRRLRSDELRLFLATLSQQYRLQLENPTRAQGAIEALVAIREAGEALIRNPNEALLLQALLWRLPNFHGFV